METHRSVARWLGFSFVVIGAASTLAGSPAASEPFGSAGSVQGAEAGGLAPRIHHAVPSRLRSKIESGFELAFQRLRQEPLCRNVFADLGADGLSVLSTTFYLRPDLRLEKQVCSRALAFTMVGGAPTWVCGRFAGLNDRRAATVLLHEALHHAGLDERPHDPEGPSPAAIDDLVRNACGL